MMMMVLLVILCQSIKKEEEMKCWQVVFRRNGLLLVFNMVGEIGF